MSVFCFLPTLTRLPFFLRNNRRNSVFSWEQIEASQESNYVSWQTRTTTDLSVETCFSTVSNKTPTCLTRTPIFCLVSTTTRSFFFLRKYGRIRSPTDNQKENVSQPLAVSRKVVALNISAKTFVWNKTKIFEYVQDSYSITPVELKTPSFDPDKFKETRRGYTAWVVAQYAILKSFEILWGSLFATREPVLGGFQMKHWNRAYELLRCCWKSNIDIKFKSTDVALKFLIKLVQPIAYHTDEDLVGITNNEERDMDMKLEKHLGEDLEDEDEDKSQTEFFFQLRCSVPLSWLQTTVQVLFYIESHATWLQFSALFVPRRGSGGSCIPRKVNMLDWFVCPFCFASRNSMCHKNNSLDLRLSGHDTLVAMPLKQAEDVIFEIIFNTFFQTFRSFFFGNIHQGLLFPKIEAFLLWKQKIRICIRTFSSLVSDSHQTYLFPPCFESRSSMFDKITNTISQTFLPLETEKRFLLVKVHFNIPFLALFCTLSYFSDRLWEFFILFGV